MAAEIAVVGAGLLGRVLAYKLGLSGYQVSLFESDSESGGSSAAYTGAGMLAPFCELENAEPLIFTLGQSAVDAWKVLLEKFAAPVFLQRHGSLAVAHSGDRPLLERMHQRIIRKLAGPHSGVQPIHQRDSLEALEPELGGRFSHALYFPLEGQLDNRQLMASLLKEILKDRSITCRFHTKVSAVEPRKVWVESTGFSFDQIIDCRGLGAKADIPSLRGVRGEIIDVFAPDVELLRPIRLLHPRYPLYIVPRQKQRFLIGATSLESDDMSPVSVQSALELLSAAFSVHPGFATASIIELRVNCRPALPDNVPRVFHSPGLLRINGLYRHGFLVTPALTDLVQTFIEHGSLSAINPMYHSLFEEEESRCEQRAIVVPSISNTSAQLFT